MPFNQTLVEAGWSSPRYGRMICPAAFPFFLKLPGISGSALVGFASPSQGVRNMLKVAA